MRFRSEPRGRTPGATQLTRHDQTYRLCRWSSSSGAGVAHVQGERMRSCRWSGCQGPGSMWSKWPGPGVADGQVQMRPLARSNRRQRRGPGGATGQVRVELMASSRCVVLAMVGGVGGGVGVGLGAGVGVRAPNVCTQRGSRSNWHQPSAIGSISSQAAAARQQQLGSSSRSSNSSRPT